MLTVNPEYFKGDEDELKFYNAAAPVMDKISDDLDLFFNGAYTASPFILMLYDDKRIPFAERIKRLAFVEFVKEMFSRYSFVGSFESYLFVLRAIFGAESEITF